MPTRARVRTAAVLTSVAAAGAVATSPAVATRLSGSATPNPPAGALSYNALAAMFGSSSLAPRATVEAGLPSLQREMRTGQITNPSRKSAFLATLVSESAMAYNADEYGQTATYRGRGYMQLTGDFNYQDAGSYFGVNLLRYPDKAKTLRWSAPIARWYWTVARPSTNTYADQHDMDAVNRMIGFAWNRDEALRRCTRFKSAFKYFTGTLPAHTKCLPARLPAEGSTSWYFHPESRR